MVRPSTEKKDLEQYLREVSAFPLLTPQREKELGLRIRRGDREAVRELVEGNLRFVVHYAKKYLSPNVSLMDLISEGNLALVEAAKRFDPTRETRFVTYAGWWLRQAMLQAISKGHPLSLTPKTLGQIYRMEKAASGLRGSLERPPTLKELAEELGLKESEVQALQQVGHDFLSLNKSTGEADDQDLAERLPEQKMPSPEYNMLKRSFEEEVCSLVDRLPPSEAQVIRMRFGLDQGEPAALQKIADRMKVSRERIRQLEARALRRMRALARGLKLEGYLH